MRRRAAGPLTPRRRSAGRTVGWSPWRPKIPRARQRRQVQAGSENQAMEVGGGWWRLVEVGGGDPGVPRRYDGVGNLFPRDSTSQLLRKRGCRACGLRLAGDGRNDVLRSVEQD